MMIGIAISMLLLAGVIELLITNKQAYRIQESASLVNENARFTIMKLNRSIRIADHWGGVEASDISVTGAVPGVGNDCEAGWTFKTRGVEGWKGDDGTPTTSPLPTCIPNADYVANSDIVALRYAGAETVTTADLVNNVAPTDDTYVRTSVGRRGVITTAGNSGGDIDQADLGADLGFDPLDLDPGNILNYPYVAEAYFVRPCLDKAGSADGGCGVDATCAASDDNGNPIPTLVRLYFDRVSGNLCQEEIVEGVEQMKATYGVDSNNDLVADQYFSATAVTAANDWPNVVAVNMSVIVRSPEEMDLTVGDPNANYLMAGGYLHDANTDFDPRYKRKLFTTIIQVRNSVRQ